jgi:translocation and assembly module TamB
MKRTLRISIWLLGGALSVLLMLAVAALLILPSAWFREKVRSRVVYEVERATGGRTELAGFRFEWQTLTAEVDSFVLHGTETNMAEPLFRADSIEARLKIISVFRKDVDLDSVVVNRPYFHLRVDANGVSNLPKPKIERKPGGNIVEQLLKLAINNIDVSNGVIVYSDKRLPIDFHGKYLKVALDYDFATPSYQGNVSVQDLKIESNKTLPFAMSLESQVALLKNSLQVKSAHLRLNDTVIEASGVLNDFASPHIDLDVNAAMSLADMGKPLRIPQPHVGTANFKGKLTYERVEKLRINGHLTGQGLGFKQGKADVRNISMAAMLQFDLEKLYLKDLRLNALGGSFDGTFDLAKYERFKANGRINGFSVGELTTLAGLPPSRYSGAITGPVQLTGTLGKAKDLQAAGRFSIVPGKTGVPVSGTVKAGYEQRIDAIHLGNSTIQMPSSRLDISGTLGQQLRVRLDSRDTNDLVPAIATVSEAVANALPFRLRPNGSALFDGYVNGPLQNPLIEGTVTMNHFDVQGQTIDLLNASVKASSTQLVTNSFAIGQNQLRLQGSADLELRNWKLDRTTAVSADVKFDNASVSRLLAEAGRKLPIEGMLHGSAKVQGTADAPKVAARLTLEQPTVYGEKFDRMTAEISYASSGVEVINGVAELGTARIALAGAFEHPLNDWKNGRIRFNASTAKLSLQQIANLSAQQPNLRGDVEIKGAGSATLRNGELFLQNLDGQATLRELSINNRPIGGLSAIATTTGEDLQYTIVGNIRNSKLSGGGDLQLTGDYQAKGSLEFSTISLAALRDIGMGSSGLRPTPLDGIVSGRINFNGPMKRPEQVTARLFIPTLRIRPGRQTVDPVTARDLALQNAEPILIEYKAQALHIRSAHLTGRDTDVQLTGVAPLDGKSPTDVKASGDINIAILQNYNPDLVSSGIATVNASLKGSYKDPQLSGRVELKNASFYLADFPNGVDQAHGVILFDQRRATIETFRAQTGGGNVGLSGFVGFSRDEAVYRLQGRADRVRVRYPEGVSTTVNSTLNLTGTSNRSLLSGVVTVQRAGFNPRTDLGSLLTSRPADTPTAPNEYIRGMQVDIRVESVPNLQLQTSMTSDLQAEADLRLRGTAAKPAVLGRVTVNQGEIQFFGTKYTINRGEIGFYNATKIEPVIDMDLETRVRGVIVNINFNGPISKLNVSYRSDPPLQSTEIVALLAVGRTPGTNSALATSQNASNQGSVLNSSTNSLLGQAVTAPVSSRLQRFFGVSRLKIDPQLTGINAVPQARLTVEQQISRDITMTYITNLSQANQQIIRLEWDVNRNWSVVALREENGVFGIDFFFKKRFK